jgi:hypothetical protein
MHVAAQLSTLPTEIILLVLSYLNPPSLARCQRVCRKWNQLAKEDDIWRQVAIQHVYVKQRPTRANDEAHGSYSGDFFCSDSIASKYCLLQDRPRDSTSYVHTGSEEHVRDLDRSANEYAALASSSVTNYYSHGLDSYQTLCKKKWCLDRSWQCDSSSKASGIHLASGEPFPIPNHLMPSMRNLDAAPPYVGPGWNQQDDLVEEVGRDVWRIKIE